jgi:histidinol-phosphate aminotransferase
MLGFIRSDIANLSAYQPHPGGVSGKPAEIESLPLDRLDTNESPFDLPDELKEKLAWSYKEQIEANRYPDGSYAALKTAIAQYVTESANLLAAIAPEQISVGNGSDELIRSLLIATCLGGAGSVLVANPTFSMYAILAQTLGIPVVTVERSPQADFQINLEQAQAAIAQTQTPPIRVVFVVHPNSPTANALTPAELDWLRSLPEHILVVIDEAYFEFSQTSTVGELAQHPNWVITRTFSKAFRLAAHRLGYCVAHPEAIAVLEKIRLPYNLPTFSQSAALLALTHRQQLLASIPQLISERDKLLTTLAQHPALQVWPSAANFIYLRLQTADGEALTQLHQKLKAQGTLGRQIAGGLRITIGSTDENARTLNRLEAILAEHFPSPSGV